MTTIKDERLKLWSVIGDAMADGNLPLALLRMRVFAANIQDVKSDDGGSAFGKWTEFEKTVDNKGVDQRKTVEIEAKNLNPLQRYQAMGIEIAGIDEWAIWEKYYFLYRLAMEHTMFPEGIIDYRPRGRETPRGSEQQ